MKQKIDQNELFRILVSQLNSSALTQLGVNANPVTGKQDKNIEAATMTIGILESLLFKTAGNLTKEEDRLLSGSVRDLKTNLMKETR